MREFYYLEHFINDILSIMHESFIPFYEEKKKEVKKEFFKSGAIKEDGEENDNYYKLKTELENLRKVSEGEFQEIICHEDLPFYKNLNEIIKNHYGENIVPLETTKEDYTYRELIDLNIVDPSILSSHNHTKKGVNYSDKLYFSNEESYFKVVNPDGSLKTIIGIPEQDMGMILEELEVYNNGTKLRFQDVLRRKINVKDISKEILDLIPEDFGEYKFSGVSPYSNSLYFTSKDGYKARISDHRLGKNNQYTDFLLYNILINPNTEESEKSTVN